MPSGIKRSLNIARKNAEKEIAMNDSDCVYNRGLRSEGYYGGYLDALNDVELALNGVTPNGRVNWYQAREQGDA